MTVRTRSMLYFAFHVMLVLMVAVVWSCLALVPVDAMRVALAQSPVMLRGFDNAIVAGVVTLATLKMCWPVLVTCDASAELADG